jgi:hypothetical protein
VPITHAEDWRKNSRCLRWPPRHETGSTEPVRSGLAGQPEARSARIKPCVTLAQKESAALGTRFACQLLRDRKAPARKSGQALRPGDAPGFGPWLTPSPSRLDSAGDAMDARKVAAHFAAFVWFSNRSPKARENAVRFANDAWPAFLPLAHEGLGRLLIKIATPRSPRPGADACACQKACAKRQSENRRWHVSGADNAINATRQRGRKSLARQHR